MSNAPSHAFTGKKKPIYRQQIFIPLTALLFLALFNLVIDPSFFTIPLAQNSVGDPVLTGYLITILDNASELAILAIGMTFVEYLTQMRINKAKQLLHHSPKHSGEIAFEVGYRDPRYFSFLFKETQGCTPSQYRAKEEAGL